jgi:two-component system phosphate regulon sensor histidine kinase PhoR
MSTSDDEDRTTLIVFEVVHDLVRESIALKAAVRSRLFADSGRGQPNDGSRISELGQRASLYSDLESIIEHGELSPGRATTILGIVLHEIDYFGVQVENLLGSLTREEPVTVAPQPVRLEPLMREVIDFLEFLAADKRVSINLRMSGDPVLSLDRRLVYRMLVNLLDNAIKCSFSGSEKTGVRSVLVEARRHTVHNDWAITITSYGVAIDQEEIDSGYIFRYGARGSRSSGRGRTGTGIGLAEAKRIAEAHRGRLCIESRILRENTYLTTAKLVLPGGQDT